MATRPTILSVLTAFAVILLSAAILWLFARKRKDARRRASRRAVLATTLHRIGNAITARLKASSTDVDEARRTLDECRTLFNARDPLVLHAAHVVGFAINLHGAPSKAVPLLREAFEGRTYVLGSTHLDTLKSQRRLAMATEASGASLEGECMLRELLDLPHGDADDGSAHAAARRLLRADVAADLASVLRRSSTTRLREAQRLVDDALAVMEASGRDASAPTMMIARNQLGGLLQQLGENEKARPHLETALELRRAHLGAAHPQTLNSTAALATLLCDLGQTQHARTLFGDTLAVATASLGAEHRVTAIMRAAQERIDTSNAQYVSRQLARIDSAVKALTAVPYPVCYVRFADFKSHGKLLTHETARQEHMLHVMDTMEDLVTFAAAHETAFISQCRQAGLQPGSLPRARSERPAPASRARSQWLARAEPDPHNVHFDAICRAVEAFCAEHALLPAEMFLWVDYHSIPQRNRTQQRASIGSLGLYSSVARFFIAVTPPAAGANGLCDQDTYARRGVPARGFQRWCRLEQLARLVIGGPGGMYLFDGATMHSFASTSSERMLAEAIDVFGGDFTVDSDKHNIVDICVGLWATSLVQRHLKGGRTHLVRIHELIAARLRECFPEAYFGDLIELLEEGLSESNPRRDARVAELRSFGVGKLLVAARITPVQEVELSFSADALAATKIARAARRHQQYVGVHVT